MIFMLMAMILLCIANRLVIATEKCFP